MLVSLIVFIILYYCDSCLQAAAVERLEESKNKIEGLLDWISNIGKENMSDVDQSDRISNENGNFPAVTSAEGLIRMEDDDANGNALQTTEKEFGRETSGKQDSSLELDKQYDRVKVRLFCCICGNGGTEMDNALSQNKCN